MNRKGYVWSAWALLTSAGVLVCGGCFWRKPPREPPSFDPVVLRDWQTYVPRLITSSPDGKRFVARIKDDCLSSCECLGVYDVASGALLRRMQITDPILRVAWRPGGNVIAYFRQTRITGVRRLFFWDLETDRHQEISIPMTYAQPFVHWSPDGRFIAFTTENNRLIIVGSSGEVKVVEDEVYTFDWNSRSTLVAAGRKDDSQISFIDPKSGAVSKSLEIDAAGALQEIVWQDRDQILVLHQELSDPGGAITSTVRSVAAQSGAQRVLVASNADIREIKSLPDGQGLLWHRQGKTGAQDVVISAAPDAQPFIIGGDGAFNFRRFSSDQRHVDVMHYSQSVHRLLRYPFSEGKPMLLAEQRGAQGSNIVHETVFTASADGTIAFLVSRLVGNQHANSVIIRLRGGPGINLGSDRWAEAQLYLRQGVHFIHMESRGPHTSDDILAACNYAHQNLGVPRDRIVLFGNSEAAPPIIDAIIQDPHSAGIITVVGMTIYMRRDPLPTSHQNICVLAFHGEKDPKAPFLEVQEALKGVFGNDAFNKSRSVWHVFPEEGHWIERDTNNATVHTTVLRRLDIIDRGHSLADYVGAEPSPRR